MNVGLGLSDGDLVLNHLERVAYIIKGGEPVKLANFGERSVLRPATCEAGARCSTVSSPTGGPDLYDGEPEDERCRDADLLDRRRQPGERAT